MMRFNRVLCDGTRRRGLSLLVFVLMAVTLLVGTAPAFAKDYEVTQVDIDATLGDDGSLAVTERRVYSFDGSFGGIYWDIPKGSFEGREVTAAIGAVGVTQRGVATPFAAADDGAPATYTLAEEDDCYRLKLYWPVEDQDVTFEVSYELSGLATRWADVGELYWQFVPADPTASNPWKSITATVHLPVPAGEQVRAGENVRVWGHGPLEGSVDVEGSDVVYRAPFADPDDYLEARVVLPAAWLARASVQDEGRLDAILAEEGAWAQKANERRRRARRITYGILGVLAGASLLTSLVTFAIMKGFGRRKRNAPAFADQYYRDVPTGDHPAVLGMLHRGASAPTGDDMTATLMRLTDQGRVHLDTVEVDVRPNAKKEKRQRDFRLTRAGGRKDATGPQSAIDNAAYRFLFNTVAGHHKLDNNLRGPAGEPYVLTSFFEDVAKSSESLYVKGYQGWARAVEQAYSKRGFEVGRDDGGVVPALLGFLDIGLMVVLGLAGGLFGTPYRYLVPAIVVSFAAGLFCIWNNPDDGGPIYSPEALEVRAKLAALDRWFNDFTRLKEAIPTDVVLWNRLLVLATAMGSADKVVHGLRVVAPALFEDPSFITYGWYDREKDEDILPASMLTRRLNKAQSATIHGGSSSTESVSHSRDSSSGGGGGGFSSGGGGGFSGGGRGGAF